MCPPQEIIGIKQKENKGTGRKAIVKGTNTDKVVRHSDTNYAVGIKLIIC